MKAVNLSQVVRFFNPRAPVSGRDLQTWFIERPNSPRGFLRVALQEAQAVQEPIKLLLVGHRGGGKSTELNKLAEELADSYQVIDFDALTVIGRSTVRHEDLMLTLSTQITRYCIDHGLIGRPIAEPLGDAWRGVADWWRQIVSGLNLSPRGELTTYAELSTFLGQIEIGASQSPFTRDQINAQVNRQMPELIRRLNWVIEQAQRQIAPRRLLLVVEGLDKIDLEAARNIFRDHTPTITAPEATLIYTFPLAMRYSGDYQGVLRHFHYDQYLHNFALRRSDGGDDDAGRAGMRQMVQRRLETQLIRDDALDLMVQTSGGLPVDLVKLARSAAIYALRRSADNQQIELGDAQRAVQDLRRELAANLSQQEWRLLAARHHDRLLSNEPEIEQLLYKGALIEYSNGVQWCDVHPALWGLLNHYARGG